MFPEPGDVKWGKAWRGQLAMTRDHLPHIHNLVPGRYEVIGYDGREITTGTVIG
jgi:glycine/D-amino acid oxidase-like deaminating enzyme